MSWETSYHKCLFSRSLNGTQRAQSGREKTRPRVRKSRRDKWKSSSWGESRTSSSRKSASGSMSEVSFWKFILFYHSLFQVPSIPSHHPSHHPSIHPSIHPSRPRIFFTKSKSVLSHPFLLSIRFFCWFTHILNFVDGFCCFPSSLFISICLIFLSLFFCFGSLCCYPTFHLNSMNCNELIAQYILPPANHLIASRASSNFLSAHFDKYPIFSAELPKWYYLLLLCIYFDENNQYTLFRMIFWLSWKIVFCISRVDFFLFSISFQNINMLPSICYPYFTDISHRITCFLNISFCQIALQHMFSQ